jgi:high-affinity iron transporter
MLRLIHLLLTFILLAAWGHVVARSGSAQGLASGEVTPAAAAEEVRTLLTQAQMAVINEQKAGDLLAEAQSTYEREIKSALEGATQPAELIERAFAQANKAVEEGNGPLFAAAHAEIWTALLNVAYMRVETAVQSGDIVGAREWLALREFRQATRFSRPNADATLAIAALGKGELSPDEALQEVRADLLDTYQARLGDALRSAPEAYKQGFTVQLARQTSLAAGYFGILSAQYGTQYGDAKLGEVRAAFEALKQAGVEGKDPTPFLAEVERALEGFRAAPLTQEDLARRAGQLLRFLSLVPMEYGRGVSGGQVTHDIEIQEAITFQAGATSA